MSEDELAEWLSAVWHRAWPRDCIYFEASESVGRAGQHRVFWGRTPAEAARKAERDAVE